LKDITRMGVLEYAMRRMRGETGPGGTAGMWLCTFCNELHTARTVRYETEAGEACAGVCSGGIAAMAEDRQQLLNTRLAPEEAFYGEMLRHRAYVGELDVTDDVRREAAAALRAASLVRAHGGEEAGR